ncbi:unnamed protein product [Symbiodinium sp. KB8]|nr:unnamed protein product [Symbiodinium sp. KB8]
MGVGARVGVGCRLLRCLLWAGLAVDVPLACPRQVRGEPDIFSFDPPAALGRRERSLLTHTLNLQSHSVHVVEPGASFLGRDRRAWMRRRTPRLFERQRRSWRAQPSRRWRGWPCRGRRIGEASHPGPPDRERPHLDDHAAGTLQGQLPPPYLLTHDLDLCSVCGLTVGKRYHGTHARCRPAHRHPATARIGMPGTSNPAGPGLAAIFSAQLPVLRHVPKAARGVWAQCLARALALVAAHNTLVAWQELFMLPKAILHPAPRGGAHRRDQAARFTQRRCQRWLEGEPEELWEDVPARRQRQPAVTEDAAVANRHTRCRALAAEGELSRACAALTSPPLLEASQDTVAKLRDKHPQAAPARPSLVQMGPPPQHSVPDVSVEQVAAAVRSFRKGSAAGPTGLRGDHLREALQSNAHSDEVATHLTEVVRILLTGTAPAEVMPHLAGATLHALPKDSGDLRPIAVGEVLRRLTAKSESPPNLAPLISIMPLIRSIEPRCCVKCDFSFLASHPGQSGATTGTPGSCTVLTSEVGVQQGDPLGPLLFALALQPALQAAQSGPEGHRPELVFAYLDDVCLAGGSRQVAAALARLAAAARQIGLQLNPRKCELIPCGGPTSAVDARAFPAGVCVNTTGNFMLLGAPIGHAPYTETRTLAERVEKARPLLQAIASLDDPQTGLLLLRHCASYCKIVFALRVTPPQLLGSAAQAFDKAVRECLELLCTGPLPDAAWLQASLSTSAGGLGLRHAQRHAPAAYAASLAAVQSRCLALDRHFQPDWPAVGAAAATAALNETLLPADRVPVPAPPTVRQQSLSQALDRALLAQLGAPAPGHEAYRAHLQLLQQPHAGAWLHAPPSEALGLHVEAGLFRVMVRMRLRLPVATSESACPLCDGVADLYGDHARACPCGGDRTKRHNRLRSLLAARAQAAGLSPELEKPGLLPPRLDDAGFPEDGVRTACARRPADVWVPSWGLHGPAAFDLAVTVGLRPGRHAAVAAAADRPAADYEARKSSHLNTRAVCEAQGLQFIPLVVEANGGWAPSAVRTWKELAAALALRTGEPVSQESDRLYQALAISLQRENARAVLRRIPETPVHELALADP